MRKSEPEFEVQQVQDVLFLGRKTLLCPTFAICHVSMKTRH